MCCTKDWIQSPPPRKEGSREQKPHPSRRSKVRVQRLIIRRRYEATTTTMAGEEDMELKNLKLYLENRSILEENEKLRQKALRLRQENLALLAQFQKKSSFS